MRSDSLGALFLWKFVIMIDKYENVCYNYHEPNRIYIRGALS